MNIWTSNILTSYATKFSKKGLVYIVALHDLVQINIVAMNIFLSKRMYENSMTSIECIRNFENSNLPHVLNTRVVALIGATGQSLMFDTAVAVPLFK